MDIENSKNNQYFDLDQLFLKSSNFSDKNLARPGEETKQMFLENAKVLVVGAGGLGCELLKNLAYYGFKEIHVVDLDKIDLTNLNRQFLFRQKDIGKYKAEVAAEFINKRIKGANVIPHIGKIQDFDLDFYWNFHIIIGGLDNIEARRFLNLKVHELIEYDEDGNIQPYSVKPFIDGGSEGFRGQVRVVIPYKTSCYECTLNTLQDESVKFGLCTISETPRIPEHCIQYAMLVQWEKSFDRPINKDSIEDMNWIFKNAQERAEKFGIKGVTLTLTQGVVKNIIPAIASTNALIAAACANEAFKLVTNCNNHLNNNYMFMGQTGINSLTINYEKNQDCIICTQKF